MPTAHAAALFPCPCCGYGTLSEPASDDICPICRWEDDGQDSVDADEVRGGPNGLLSLTEARQNFLRLGACDADSLGRSRPPGPNDRRIRTFILLDDGQIREVTARA